MEAGETTFGNALGEFELNKFDVDLLAGLNADDPVAVDAGGESVGVAGVRDDAAVSAGRESAAAGEMWISAAGIDGRWWLDVLLGEEVEGAGKALVVFGEGGLEDDVECALHGLELGRCGTSAEASADMLLILMVGDDDLDVVAKTLLRLGVEALEVECGPADPDHFTWPGAKCEAAADVLRIRGGVAGAGEVAGADVGRGESAQTIGLPTGGGGGKQKEEAEEEGDAASDGEEERRRHEEVEWRVGNG